MDLHISVIADFKTACPEVEVVDWSLSGHSWVMHRQPDFPHVINPNTWRNLDSGMIIRFQQKYDRFLRQFDGFIVGYASCFAMLYERYNKPIIMLNAVRYDVPFCQTRNFQMIQNYNECLLRLHQTNKLIIVSNNKADQLYLLRGCGLQSKYIPSLCDYTHVKYAPTKSTFLCYHGTVPDHPLVTPKSQLRHPHDWKDLTEFKGIISFPYEVSLMSLFEQFTMGLPLFFPSKSFWKANPNIQSISAYWGQMPGQFYELTDLSNWIELADMYDTFQSPNTYYFDSFDHLFQLLESFVYVDDTAQREERAASIRKSWKEHLLTYGLS